MKKTVTPLRYPGGKSQFFPFVQKLMEANHLAGEYLEPYAGGAGIALELLLSGQCNKIHINDVDKAIYHFWLAITQDTDNFLRLLQDTPITIEQWHMQKYILTNPDCFTITEHGFSTFFLNRTNRSGILKAGVIGGLHQNGNYKLDCRFNKIDLQQRIERIASMSSKIQVYNEDAFLLLERVEDFLPKNSLIYLDPPYYVKGQGLYRNYYTHQNHVEIETVLAKLSIPWIVSYDNCIEIKEIYQHYHQEEYSLNYSVQNKVKGSEVMIYAPYLQHIISP